METFSLNQSFVFRNFSGNKSPRLDNLLNLSNSSIILLITISLITESFCPESLKSKERSEIEGNLYLIFIILFLLFTYFIPNTYFPLFRSHSDTR